MTRGCWGMLLLLLGSSSLTGQEAKSPPIKLAVRPAAAPSPALKYQFLPELKDMTGGNAALLYQRAHSPDWFAIIRKWLDEERGYDWLERPLKEFPRDKASVLRHSVMLREVDRAARREFCDWELTERVRREGFAFLIPDFQAFREYGMLLGLRARVEIVDKDYGKAVYTLQTGFALGRHVSDAPLLISHLIGNAVVSTMLDRVEDLMQAEGAPNLYWALTALPRPLTDLGKALQGERLALEAAVPELRTIETTPLTTEQVKKLGNVLGGYDVYALGARPRANLNRQFGTLASAMRAYPVAKRALIAQGRKAEEVEALPVLQVILIHSLRQYRHYEDELHKWVHVPYWQALPGLSKTVQELKSDLQQGGSPFLELLPPIQRVYEASIRLERRIAALRCLEAVRLHAAANAGKLPASLGDIGIAPIPVDPATGKSFVYHVDGNRVTLRDPLLDNQQPALPTAFHYEMTFQK